MYPAKRILARLLNCNLLQRILAAMLLSFMLGSCAQGTPQAGPAAQNATLAVTKISMPTEIYPPPPATPFQSPTPRAYPPPGEGTPEPGTTVIYGPPPTPFTPEIPLEENRVVSGYGDFPILHVIAPASDGQTAALYRVEGDTAAQVAIFKDRSAGAQVVSKPSPDGKRLAVLFPPSMVADSYIELVDLESGNITNLVEVAGELQPEIKNSDSQTITAFVWADDGHILYSKVMLPGGWDPQNVPEGDGPLPIQGEIWQIDLESLEQRLLVTAPLYRLLGVSKDGQTYFVSGLIERSWRQEDLYYLDAASGELRGMWGADAKPGRYTYGVEQATLPDGSLRLFIAYSEEGPGHTVFGKFPDLWMIDPETGERQVVWDGDQADPDNNIYMPFGIFWSPTSMDEFLYRRGAELWKKNLLSGEETVLGEYVGGVVGWLDENIVTLGREPVENKIVVLRLADLAGNVLGEITIFDQANLDG